MAARRLGVGVADWTCASCGKLSPEGMAFCGFCGASAAGAPPTVTWSCRDCGTSNSEAHAFCGGCGARAQATRTEELRLVTALFADISGFTTLADALDVESLHEVITPLVGGLTRIAERYEGFVEKYAGDAILVVYGAPTTHEDDAQRALLAALDMHAELPRLLAELPPEAAHLTIHVGVNTGRVIARQAGSDQQSDYAVLGDSVILAQRLESVCPSGETYVGPTTYELCKDEFDFEPVGELTLKGKLKPIEGFRLVGRRSAKDATSRPILGRQPELAAAEEGVASAAVTTLIGGPGVGKSRLLAELRRRTTADGVQWLAARCLSYGASLAYWPLADLLRQELRVPPTASSDELAALLERALPAGAVAGARRLLGLEAGGPPELARREVHDAIATWLTERVSQGPAALVLEDAHWVDRSTADVLAELVRVQDPPVAIVLTTREEGRATAEAVAGTARHRLVELGPLAADAVAGVAGSVLGSPAAGGLRELLVDRTAGNPLHVVELTRSLVESRALVQTVDGWDLRPGWDLAAVPATLERVFAARLDGLPPPAAATLQLASVIGRKVGLRLLDALDDAGDVATALPLLVEAGMLEPEAEAGVLSFSHALLQDVVYSRLLRKRRRELHRRVADVARRLYGEGDDTIGLLARHLFLAEAGEEAVEPLLRAGRRAAGLYANDEAAVHLEQAVQVLERLDGVGARLDEARLLLAQVQEKRGVYEEAQRLYELRRESDGDPQAWRGLMSVLRSRGNYEAALQTFVEACRRLDPREPRSGGVWVEAGWTLALVGRASDAVSTLRTALRLLGDQDPVLRAELLCQLVDAERLLGTTENTLHHAQEAVDLVSASAASAARVVALRMLSMALLDAGRSDEAAATLREALALAEQIGALDEAAGCLLNLGLIALSTGQATEAVARARAAVRSFEKLDHKSGRAIGYCNLADALRADGQLDEARRWCEKGLSYASAIGHGLAAADVLRTQARIELARGDVPAALSAAQRSGAAFTEQDAPGEAVEAWALAAEAARALDDQPAAEAAEAARAAAAGLGVSGS